MKKMKILICRVLKAVHYRVYKCTAILHTPMGRTHGENSMSKLDNDAKRVANIYMELPSSAMVNGRGEGGATHHPKHRSDLSPLPPRPIDMLIYLHPHLPTRLMVLSF